MADWPKKFDPVPETKYVIQMVGGKIPDEEGERYPNPRIFKKQYDKKDGTGKYWGWNVTIFAKEIKYVDGEPETDNDTFGEYTFWVPEEVREIVDELFEAGTYKFYLRRKSVWYKDSKGKNKTKSLYQVSAGLSGLKDIQEKLLDVKPIKKAEPEPDIPFDDDMGDDKVAFKEDVKTGRSGLYFQDKPIEELHKADIEQISDIDLNEILITLKGIEKGITDIAEYFRTMLNKFTIKIKKVDE